MREPLNSTEQMEYDQLQNSGDLEFREPENGENKILNREWFSRSGFERMRMENG